jgi:hypothetical protein
MLPVAAALLCGVGAGLLYVAGGRSQVNQVLAAAEVRDIILGLLHVVLFHALNMQTFGCVSLQQRSAASAATAYSLLSVPGTL